MGTPTWMKDVADAIIPDISGRKKAAAEAAAEQARKAKEAADAKAAADKAAAEAKVQQISFKKGGKIDGIAQRGKTRGRVV